MQQPKTHSKSQLPILSYFSYYFSFQQLNQLFQLSQLFSFFSYFFSYFQLFFSYFQIFSDFFSEFIFKTFRHLQIVVTQKFTSSWSKMVVKMGKNRHCSSDSLGGISVLVILRILATILDPRKNVEHPQKNNSSHR